MGGLASTITEVNNQLPPTVVSESEICPDSVIVFQDGCIHGTPVEKGFAVIFVSVEYIELEV